MSIYVYIFLTGIHPRLTKTSDELLISENGAFTFPTAVADGELYRITIAVQPAAPSQTCLVINGEGTVAGGDVISVQVRCDPDAIAISTLSVWSILVLIVLLVLVIVSTKPLPRA